MCIIESSTSLAVVLFSIVHLEPLEGHFVEKTIFFFF